MGVAAKMVSKARGGPCVFLVQQLGWLERLAEVGHLLHKHVSALSTALAGRATEEHVWFVRPCVPVGDTGSGQAVAFRLPMDL